MGNFAKELRRRTGVATGRVEGYCVICGDFGKLTDDHVPPKGCIGITDVVLRSFMQNDNDAPGGLIIQGGVKFRTICENCNSHLLGRLYDPSLRDLINQATRGMIEQKKKIVRFPMIRIKIQPNIVAKALIGHLLAAHSVNETEKRIENLGANETLRNFFLGSIKKFPTEWKIYCWPYPSRQQKIIRHVSLMNTGVHNPAEKILYGHIIKFVPLAFFIVKNPHSNARIMGTDITPDITENNDYEEKIILDLANTPHWSYPEHPVGDWVTLIADDQTSVATPR